MSSSRCQRYSVQDRHNVSSCDQHMHDVSRVKKHPESHALYPEKTGIAQPNNRLFKQESKGLLHEVVEEEVKMRSKKKMTSLRQ